MVTSKKIFSVVCITVLGILTLVSGTALAETSYLNSFNARYGTSGTALDSCSLCHPSVPSLNGYGDDYGSGHNFAAIEGLDSDGDGFVNLDEINARTLPGSAVSFPDTLPSCTDGDGDGFAIEGGNCGAVDCNDSSPVVFPGAQELCTDSIDNNCNGLIDNQDPQAVNCPPVCTDLDGDGYALEGGNCGQVDCNDNSPLVNPGAAENCSDGLDNDCDSLVDIMDPDAVNCPVEPPPAPSCTDNDNDGFSLEGGDCGLVDCHDSDPAIHPEAVESCTDSVDNNCDGLIDFADPNAVGCPVGCTDLDLDGYAVEGGECGPVDCNDQDEFINPAAAEECTDAIDNDCNDLIDIADPNVVNCPTGCTDVDGDGYAVDGDACGQVDCSDSDSSINPGATDICGDGIDQNCDGSDLSCTPAIQPPTISLSVSGETISLNWSTVAGATGYRLSYAPYPYTGPQSIVSIDLGNVTSFSYELWKGASFYVTVQSYNAGGSSSYSNIEYFTIESRDDDGDDGDDGDDDGDDGDDDGENDGDDDAAPVAPSISLSITGLNVAISWPAVDGATGYTIFYAPNPYLGPQSVASADLGNKTSVSYDLWAGASYRVAVQAYNDHGNSDFSNIEDFVIETPVVVPDPVDGSQLYAANCASCHGALNVSNVGGEDAEEIEEAIEDNEGGMGFLSFLTSAELNAVADVLASHEQSAGVRTGQVVYNDNCAGCHLVNGYDASGNIDLASKGSAASAKLASGHGGNVKVDEIVNVSNWLDTWTPVPPTAVARTGQVVYNDNCAGCHLVNGYDASGNIDLASKGSAASSKLASGHGGSVSGDEIVNVSNWLDTWAPVPPPAVARTGQAVYNDNCAGCHLVNGYDASGNIDLASKGSAASSKLASGHGGSVSSDEIVNVSNWLDTFSPSQPGPGSCTSCHGQPPTGNSVPNRDGAHVVHAALNGLGGNCASCHSSRASHNGNVDFGLSSSWNAKSGSAVANSNGTCSAVSCHGGATTPNWLRGSINVDSQCTSCHSSGTAQYNGYFSGEHREHVNGERISCTTCHDVNVLRNGHFSNLATRAFEQDPETTIKSSLSYVDGRCSTASCHGSERW